MEKTNEPTNKVTKFDNLSLPELVAELATLNDQKNTITLREKSIKGEILLRYEAEKTKLLSAKPEPYGVVNVQDQGFKIAITTPKKVEWDQKELAKVVDEIRTAGEDPTEYVDIEYSVPETKYKAWPQAIKEAFIKARTVRPGTPTMNISEAA